eukprot:3297580-Amphidinium_carterae.1
MQAKPNSNSGHAKKKTRFSCQLSTRLTSRGSKQINQPIQIPEIPRQAEEPANPQGPCQRRSRCITVFVTFSKAVNPKEIMAKCQNSTQCVCSRKH